MELNKKAAYLQGLVDGLGVDESTKEGKIIKAMAALLGEMADAIAAMDEDLTQAYDQINDLSEERGGSWRPTCTRTRMPRTRTTTQPTRMRMREMTTSPASPSTR